jgi:NAD(P) transhydrogenase subunit alpha
VNASSLYARNLQAFIDPFIDKEKKTLAIDWDDELAKGTAIARDGAIVNAMVAKSLGGKPAKAAPKRAAAKAPAKKRAPAKRAPAKRKPAKRAAKARVKAPAKRTSTKRQPKGGKTR